jgi:hypothetical protein
VHRATTLMLPVRAGPLMDTTPVSPLGQLWLALCGATYAAWRFWVAHEFRPRYRTLLECVSTQLRPESIPLQADKVSPSSAFN